MAVTPTGFATTTTSFRYQGDAIVEESVGSTVTRSYAVDDAGTIRKMTIPAGQTGTGTYLVTWNGHGDALGLWLQNADGSLTLANSFTYSTWGAPTTTVASGTDLGFRFLYVGASDVQWDNQLGLGLLYMHARHYSPLLGRFLQPDPSAAEANTYAYARGNPVTTVDPSGLFSLECWKLAAEAASLLFILQLRYWDLRLNADDLKRWGQHSVEGHRQQFRNVQKQLRDVMDQIYDRCQGQGPKPPFLLTCRDWQWKWAPYPDRSGTWNGHPPQTAPSPSNNWRFRVDPDAARYVGIAGSVTLAGVALGWFLVRFGGAARAPMTE
jgi:RHS repeat-associated protein